MAAFAGRDWTVGDLRFTGTEYAFATDELGHTNSIVVIRPRPIRATGSIPRVDRSRKRSARPADAMRALGAGWSFRTCNRATEQTAVLQRVILSRFNEVDIAGGLSGSKLQVTCTMSVDPFIVQ